MRRLMLLLAVAGAVIALGLPPAGAIVDGEPDEDRHPSVGALIGTVDGGSTFSFVCSGSLLSDTEFLTAAHCSPWEMLGLTEENIFVTFDPDLVAADPFEWGFVGPVVRPTTVIPVTGKAVMPGYLLPAGGAMSRNDVAVIHLAGSASAAYPGIEPIVLPTAGALSEAAAHGGLARQSVTNVGYGFQSVSTRNPTTPIAFNGLRMTSTSPILGLTRDHLTTLENGRATGEGGVCMGDSGGPNFLGTAVGPNGTLQVSLNVGQGYHGCDAGINSSQRLDLPSVLGFLAPFD